MFPVILLHTLMMWERKTLLYHESSHNRDQDLLGVKDAAVDEQGAG